MISTYHFFLSTTLRIKSLLERVHPHNILNNFEAYSHITLHIRNAIILIRWQSKEWMRIILKNY